jgi:hypothetical protein
MKVPAAWRDHVPLLVVDNEIGWFVVPTAQGIRGRQSETFALPDPGPESRIIAVYWRRIDPQNKNLL